MINLNSDDFPAPFGPIRPIFWSCWTSQLRSRKMVWAPRIRVAFETVIEIMSTPSLQLKQKRRGDLSPRREKAKKRLLIFWGQAREYRALEVKSTHTDAQEDIVRSFVSHNGKIIALNCLMAYNFLTPLRGTSLRSQPSSSFNCQDST